MRKTVSIAGVRISADKFYGEIVPIVKHSFLHNLKLKVEAALLEPDMQKRKEMLSEAEQLRMLKELTEGALTAEMSGQPIKFSAASWRRWRKFFEGILKELQIDIDRILRRAIPRPFFRVVRIRR